MKKFASALLLVSFVAFSAMSQGPTQEQCKFASAAVSDWEYMMGYGKSSDTLNAYLDKYEQVFVEWGLFKKGIRIKPGYDVAYHNRIDGVLGIISMNIGVVKERLGMCSGEL